MTKNNLFLALIMVLISNIAFSQNASYNANTKTVHIPLVEISGGNNLSDIHLKLREDGLLELVEFNSITQSDTDPFTIFAYVFEIDELYIDNNGRLIQIVGLNGNLVGWSLPGQEFTFTETPGNFPTAEEGDKGSYAVLTEGKIAYANVLGDPGDIEFSVKMDTISVGNILITDTNKQIIITGGLALSRSQDSNVFVFRKTPSDLPEPPVGEQGPFYTLNATGNVLFAKYLE